MKISKTMNVSNVVFYYNIKVYAPNTRFCIEFYQWDNLPWAIRLKYDWYFKYRTALLQVKYPKHTVECTWGNEPATGRSAERILRDKIIGKKRLITKYENILQKAIDNWNELFPITEDQTYLKAVEKINKLKQELITLESKKDEQ